jgi:hypothetical protein
MNLPPYRVGVFGELGIPNELWVTAHLLWTSGAICTVYSLSTPTLGKEKQFLPLCLFVSLTLHTICFSISYAVAIIVCQIVGYSALISFLVLNWRERPGDSAMMTKPSWRVFMALILNSLILFLEYIFGGFTGLHN